MEAYRELTRLQAIKDEDKHRQSKFFIALVLKILAIILIVGYMLSGSYQSAKETVEYYENNPDSYQSEVALGEAIESGKVAAYGPGVKEAVQTLKNAQARQRAAISRFETITNLLYIAIAACVVLSIWDVYKIIRIKKDINYTDNEIIKYKEIVKQNNQEQGNSVRAGNIQSARNVLNNSVKPIFENDFSVRCPCCHSVQSTGRKLCLKCGIHFK